MENNSPRSRALWATAAAFLSPGIFVTALEPLLAPDLWNPGHLKTGVVDFIELTFSMSLISAAIASPVVVGMLLIWRLLYRLRRNNVWTFAMVGVVAGGAFGLLFSGLDEFMSWGFLTTFSASGLLTGLLVWMVAYG